LSSRTPGPASGRLNQDIANAVVRGHKRFLGRGPTKAHAFYRDNIVVVVMENNLTDAERRLAAAGDVDAVLAMRLRYQQTMRPDLVGAIERLTGLRVEAFLSGNHIGPDLAAELFVLDGPIADRVQPPVG
jgi:uncharacterized protein YbcI